MIFEIRGTFLKSPYTSASAWKFILKVNHHVSKSSSVEDFNIIVCKASTKYYNEMGCKQLNIRVFQKYGDICSLRTCYVKVKEGQVTALSTLLCTMRVCISRSFFGYFDGHHKSTFKEL